MRAINRRITASAVTDSGGKKQHNNGQNNAATAGEMYVVQHAQRGGCLGRKTFAYAGYTDKKRRAEGACNRVDGGNDGGAVWVEVFRQGIQAVRRR